MRRAILFFALVLVPVFAFAQESREDAIKRAKTLEMCKDLQAVLDRNPDKTRAEMGVLPRVRNDCLAVGVRLGTLQDYRATVEERRSGVVDDCTAIQSLLQMVPEKRAAVASDLLLLNGCKSAGVDLEPKIAAQDIKAWAVTKAGRTCAKHGEWPRAACNLVARGLVDVGMTTEQVLASWGTPRQIHQRTSDVNGEGILEYGENRVVYVHFKKGFVTSWQESWSESVVGPPK